MGEEQRMRKSEALAMLACIIVLVAALVAAGESVGGVLAKPPEVTGQGSSRPTTVTLYAVADSYVDEGHPATNYGAAFELPVARGQERGAALQREILKHALLRFDLSTIPSEAMVQEATLELYLRRLSGKEPFTVGLDALDGSWQESTVTWNTVPVDRTNYGDALVPPGESYKQWDATAVVGDWLAGSQKNDGVLLYDVAGDNCILSFASREYRGTEYDPRLVITYTLPVEPTPTPDPGPDLVVTDIWPGEGHVCYQIRNVGETTVAAGHRTGLFVDGTAAGEDVIEEEMAPGQRLTRCFDAAWDCVPPQQVLGVCADKENDVAEADEANNCHEETWPCDRQAPVITAGPIVSDVSADGALISWETNEASDSVVKYGRVARRYGQTAADPALVTEHEVTLSGLEPGASYQVLVRSSDEAGNTVDSEPLAFQTLPLPDGEHPMVEIDAPPVVSGTVRIKAPSSDNRGTSKVLFYLDDELLIADYSPSSDGADSFFDVELPTVDHPNGPHTLKAVAYDQMGNSSSHTQVITFTNPLLDDEDPTVNIISPGDGDTVGGMGNTLIEVYAFDPDPNILGGVPVERVDFYIDDEHRFSTSEYDPIFTYSYSWPSQWEEAGTPEIKVVAHDAAGNSGEDAITVTTVEEVTPIEPDQIQVTRLETTRTDTWFRTGVRVENVGLVKVSQIEIVDRLQGFQPRTSGEGPLASSFDHVTKKCKAILGGEHYLNPGESHEFWYRFLPILTEDEVDYRVGFSTTVSYETAGGVYHVEQFSIPETDDVGVEEACESANYLIMTHPQRLFTRYDKDNVNDLLVSMAKLAAQKDGVLGYLDSYDAPTIRGLLDEGGAWGAQLTPDWESSGYLLIVGENGIVPSKALYDSGIEDATSGSGFNNNPVYPVPSVDTWYGDLDGDDKRPELVVGRIVGEDAEVLRVPIETSLLHAFDCSEALVVSGTDDDEDKEQDFRDAAQTMAGVLDDQCGQANTRILHCSDYGGYTERLYQFRQAAPDSDVIFYIGHGGQSGWSPVLGNGDFPVDFGESYPFVFGFACWTGDYSGGTSLAETFLEHGAGVYVGATERSVRPTNNEVSEMFVNNWVGAHKNTGTALTEIKQSLLSLPPEDNECKRLWALQYNLYGDPKYAVCGGGGAASDAVGDAELLSTPPAALDVVVPNYEVVSQGGVDRVSIPGPGGQLLQVDGEPQVPFYVRFLTYPDMYQVQDVVLVTRASMSTTSGLNLPLTEVEHTEDAYGGVPEPPAPGWYPEQDYSWDTFDNGDGTSTLAIRIYPFYYNASTTDAIFYTDYGFAIESISSTVQIADVSTDRDRYPQGTSVQVDVEIENGGAAQDVLVEAVVKEYGAAQMVDGLLLQELDDLQGTASFSPRWDSAGHAANDYYVQVTLWNGQGQMLDRETAPFALGIRSGRIVGFGAAPNAFEVGEQVTTTLAFSNTGTVPLSATAHIEVRDEGAELVHAFAHEIADLPPHEAAAFHDVWDTAAEAGGTYTVSGYAEYEAETTKMLTTTVSAPRVGGALYLPLICKW